MATGHGLPNKYLDDIEDDYLYHLGYTRKQCEQKFGDVKIVVCGGSYERMGVLAQDVARVIWVDHPQVTKKELSIERTDRFSFYKIGPVLSVSHGMGVPSLTIMLHEIIKLLRYAKAQDPILIRLGTSGGLGDPAGTVVITNKAFNAYCEETHEIVVMGEKVERPAKMDQDLAKEIFSCQDDHSFKTILSGTMCTDDFYEGQARTDGAVCEHTEKDKLAYLEKIHGKGISNIEMECTALAALTHRTGIRAAIVCVTLVNRLQGDQVKMTKEEYNAWNDRPRELVVKYIKRVLGK